MEYLKYILIVVAYLLGSIPTALILGKVKQGIDIREHGSGNLGTTNVFRVLGKGPGIICLIVDVLKGAIVILCIQFFKIDTENIHIFVYGAAAILGHVYPIFAGFRGGKAVATSLGVSLALTPITVGIGLASFILTLYIWGYVSVSSTVAGVTILVLTIVPNMDHADLVLKVFYGCVVAFIMFRHRKNYVHLIQGTEKKSYDRNKKKK